MEKNPVTQPFGFFYQGEKSYLQLVKEQGDPTQFALISANWTPIPFLSILDQVTLANKHKQPLDSYLRAVHLDKETLQKNFNELTPLEEIQVQFLQALLQEKKSWLLDDSFHHLTVSQIQSLLALGKKLAKAYHLSLYVVNDSRNLAKDSSFFTL